MELLIIWLLTTILSLGMEFANSMKIFKYAADEGYKINKEILDETNEQLSPEIQKKAMFPLFIPVFNLFYVMKHTMDISRLGNEIVQRLLVLGVLEDMTDDEINKYKKNPTPLNATILSLDLKEINSSSITIKEAGKEDSKIYFSFDKDSEDVIIIRATGPISKKSLEEQKKSVIDAYIKSHKKWEAFESKLSKDEEISIEKNTEENGTQEKNNDINIINDELENLRKLRNEIQQNKNENSDIKTLSLTKKRK